ncbi:MAG TPA: SIS domain-containing protein [Actinomycetota bacterium]|nr:SIS domain-containing protein [Actinomycetota bacterium]
MCGIVAVIQKQPRPRDASLEALATAVARSRDGLAGSSPAPSALASAAAVAEDVSGALAGASGIYLLIDDPAGTDLLRKEIAALGARVRELEAALDEPSGWTAPAGDDVFVRLNDGLWSVEHDRFGLRDRVAELLDDAPATPASVALCFAVETAFAALDRLEVRGRDSAGLLLLLRDHDLDPASPELKALLSEREDPVFKSFSVRHDPDELAVVYKAAREVGELGQNTAELRTKLRDDPLFRRVLVAPRATGIVLAHTRWASVGLISEPNCHPVTGEEVGRDGADVYCAINGDIDNHWHLCTDDRLRIANEITTDSKVFPVLVSRSLDDGVDPVDAFRGAMARVEGSVAIAATLGPDPNSLYLALKGSGQGLYVGLAEDSFVVASEPYGVVGMTQRHLRMQGGADGEVVVLDGSKAGELAGILRLGVTGPESPPREGEVRVAQITTRDIDRAGFPHFLLKEISQSPESFKKTIRGKVVDADGRLELKLPDESLPQSVRERLAAGAIRRILVVGQGTAAVASEGVARFTARVLEEHAVDVRAMPATELSGFFLRPDMSDTLVVPISQSGTTTDTNRAVDLVRSRGAAVIGIVNRRNSDLTERCDGVVYTSDGRDVEMSVASTKAFYAQVAAGFLLGMAVAETLAPGTLLTADYQDLMRALRELPGVMRGVIDLRPRIGRIARELAPSRANWAVAGNGDNVTAARELRIKISELCYKSVACDVTEDKKHIDLSAEPLVVVCAAGIGGAQLEDVKKELAIFVAHKAAPVAIVTEDEEGFPPGTAVIPIPRTHPSLAFVLAAMAGQIFGYEAALATDAQAKALREVRGVLSQVETASGSEPALHAELGRRLRPAGETLLRRLASGDFDSQLKTSTAAKLAGLLRYALGMTPLDFYADEWGEAGTPGRVVADLGATLTTAVDELSRPIDAIRHQAKTVTVGTSRSEDDLFSPPLVKEVLAAGVPADELSFRVLTTLGSLTPVVSRVTGRTLYRVVGDASGDAAKIELLSKDGAAAGIPSRTEWDPLLKGTKRRVALERDAMLTRGRADGRTILIVPAARGSETVGICLLHVEAVDRLTVPDALSVLAGYHGRLDALRDMVLESEPAFSEERLEEIPALDLVTRPLPELAEHWKA